MRWFGCAAWCLAMEDFCSKDLLGGRCVLALLGFDPYMPSIRHY